MIFDRLKAKKLLLAELSLIVSSVLIFRGLWLLMDTVSFFSETWVLAVLIVLGVAASIPALRYIIRK